jgi:hypothetical protein
MWSNSTFVRAAAERIGRTLRNFNRFVLRNPIREARGPARDLPFVRSVDAAAVLQRSMSGLVFDMTRRAEPNGSGFVVQRRNAMLPTQACGLAFP